jgi:hypothetical protein
MARWDRWGRRVLRDGDIVFRLGDARVLHGYFPMSRFLANASNSKFSHTGIVAMEEEGPVVYDTTGTGVARQPFSVWVLDNVGNIGVKRLRPQDRHAIPKVLAYCRKVYQEQPPFDYELGLDDQALYCVEMTEKALRRNIPLSVQLDLTYRCNERCVHCYLDHDDHGEMTTAEIKHLLDEMADAGVFILTLSGGEIFLRKDFFEILEHARRRLTFGGGRQRLQRVVAGCRLQYFSLLWHDVRSALNFCCHRGTSQAIRDPNPLTSWLVST